MAGSDESALYQRVQARHRTLVVLGTGASLFGLIVAAYVAVDLVMNGVRHPLLTILAGAGILFGIQILVFTRLTDLLLVLHEEQGARLQGAVTEAEDDNRSDSENPDSA